MQGMGLRSPPAGMGSQGLMGILSSKLSAAKISSAKKAAPAEPSDCTPVAAVAGGIPQKNSKGCIVSYTVGLQLLMI